MFNKNLFNRNAFDRSVSSSAISVPIVAGGALTMSLVMKVTLTVKPISGSGAMVPRASMLQNIGSVIEGSGELVNTSVNLATVISPIKFSGSGKMSPAFSIRTPFRGNLGGAGVFNVTDRLYFLQQIKSNITSHGSFDMQFIMQSSIDPITFKGVSDLKGNVSLQLPIETCIEGNGELILRRLSAMNENVLELININLLPGETVTIDTDLLQVLFGAKEDVSSVTSNSVFFELNPGENELIISTDSNQSLDVVAIWQNRWL